MIVLQSHLGYNLHMINRVFFSASIIFITAFFGIGALGQKQAESMISSGNDVFKIVDGVRVVENQVFTSTLEINGQEWDGAIIRNNLFRNQTGKGIQVSNVYNL